MNLPYPINLVGLDHADGSGDVVTSDGEYLGTWTLTKDPVLDGYPDGSQGGLLSFTADGETTPRIQKRFAILDCRVEFGLALTGLCREIRAWHEE